MEVREGCFVRIIKAFSSTVGGDLELFENDIVKVQYNIIQCAAVVVSSIVKVQYNIIQCAAVVKCLVYNKE